MILLLISTPLINTARLYALPGLIRDLLQNLKNLIQNIKNCLLGVENLILRAMRKNAYPIIL